MGDDRKKGEKRWMKGKRGFFKGGMETERNGSEKGLWWEKAFERKGGGVNE